MRFRLMLALVALLVLPSPAPAQTTNTLAWDYTVATTEVATYAQTVAVDGTVVSGTPTCAAKVGAPTQTTCQLAIPALSTGTHTLSVTAARGGVTAETRITGINPATAPQNPGNPRITVTVTVTIP